MTNSVPAITPLFVLTAHTTNSANITGAPSGDWRIADVERGSFEGPRLRGRVLRSGGDWVTRSGNRSRIDVRLVLETHDGVPILFRYTGRASLGADQLRLEIGGNFEAPAGAYDWLNDVQTFGLGAVLADAVQYRLFHFE